MRVGVLAIAVVMIEAAVRSPAAGIEWTAIGRRRASSGPQALGNGDNVVQRLTLKVRLTDRFNPHTEITIPIEVKKRFRRVVGDPHVTTTLTGIVRNGLNETYILEMHTTERISHTDNHRGTATWTLECNRAHGGGPGSSMVYFRAVALMRRASR